VTGAILKKGSVARQAAGLVLAVAAAWVGPAPAQQPADRVELRPLGAMPAPEAMPRVEFVFEERVTLAPPVVLGQTPLGHRQYIPITGGTIAGPKLKGEVIPGGWDFQLRYPGGCGTLSADYFLKAEDGTVIHILNESFSCGLRGANGERTYFRPRFEAPTGPHDWLNRGSFVAELEIERSAPAPAGSPAAPQTIRIRFFQIR
jgi:hypothetical protein